MATKPKKPEKDPMPMQPKKPEKGPMTMPAKPAKPMKY
jgi:hypothetical protein